MSQTGWLPAPLPITDERVYACIAVPDDTYNRQAFMGALYLLTQAFSWEGSDEQIAAETNVWFNTFLEVGNQLDNRSIDGCTEMLDCNAIVQCVLTDSQVQNAVRGIAAAPGGSATGGVPGVLPTPAQNDTDIAAGTNPGCDKDILWAQSLELVRYINRAMVDVLEQVEVAANAGELVNGLVNAFPGIAAAWDAIGGDGVLDLIDYFQEAIAEQYNAQYTQAYEEELACEIFCQCQDDCRITADRLFSVMETRLAGYINDPLGTLFDLVELIAGVSWQGSLVVDASYLLAFGSFKLASLLLPGVADRGLQMLLYLSIDEANSDWQVLCTDCGWAWTQDIASDGAGIYTYNTPILGGEVVLGTGLVGTINPADTEWQTGLEVSFTAANITQMTMTGKSYPRTSGNRCAIIALYQGSVVQRLDFSPANGDFTRTMVLNGGNGHTIDQVRFRNLANKQNDKPVISLTNIVGDGTRPPEFP